MVALNHTRFLPFGKLLHTHPSSITRYLKLEESDDEKKKLEAFKGMLNGRCNMTKDVRGDESVEISASYRFVAFSIMFDD